MANQLFHENSTLVDVELGELITALRAELRALGLKPTLVNISLYNWPNVPDSWHVTVCLGSTSTVSGMGPLLHEAMNALVEKVPIPPDLGAILGYQEVSGPKEWDDIPR